MKDLFSIDLDVPMKALEVCIYPRELVELDLEYFGLKDWRDLSDYDWRVFDSEGAARAYLNRFNETLRFMESNKEKLCVKKKIPALLYKRRYLVQTLQGEKLFTERRRLLNVKAGELLNLYDQTFTLTVKVTKVTEPQPGRYRYEFELLPEVNRASA